LEKYIASRLEMLDYPAFRAKGYEIGSGPTEIVLQDLDAEIKRQRDAMGINPNQKWMMA